jgi:GGDEF domain-containing protein
VIDTGQGISAEHLPKMFQKFQQFSQPATEERGSGLGLSLCKGLVELHQGTLRVDSELGKGTRFAFILPRLTPAGIFQEHARKMFEMTAASGKPLALCCFMIKDPKRVLEAMGSDRFAVMMTRFETLVKAAVRDESDAYVSIGDAVWLLMPSLTKQDAWQVVSRIQDRFQSYDFQQAAQCPLELAIKLVSYPEDGFLVEKLFSLLEACGASDLPAKLNAA